MSDSTSFCQGNMDPLSLLLSHCDDHDILQQTLFLLKQQLALHQASSSHPLNAAEEASCLLSYVQTGSPHKAIGDRNLTVSPTDRTEMANAD